MKFREFAKNLGKSFTRLALVTVLAGSAAAQAATIASVNGRSISDKDIHNALSNFNEGQRRSVLQDPNSRREVLTSLIDQEVLRQEAEKAKLDQSKDFQRALENFRRQYLAMEVLERNLASKVTEGAAKKFYEAHKNRYSTDEVRVQHILVEDESEARVLIQKAKKGEDFQKMAETKSKDPQAKNNRGDIGPVNWSSPFVDEFKEAALTANKGDIVGPVKTDYGYHVIKIVDKKIGRPLNYDEVELRVKGELRKVLVRNYLNKLKGQSKIQIDHKALDRL